MSYFGAAPTGNFISTASQRVTGSTNNYVDLDHAISALSDVIVLVNSIKQDITNLTFTSASRITLGGTLVSSDVVEIIYLGKSVATQTPGTATVTNDMLVNSSITLNGSAVSLGGSATVKNSKLFYAYLNSNQDTLQNNTFVKVNMANELFDVDSVYDTSTYKYTPASTGYYYLNAGVKIRQLNTYMREVAIAIYKNGSIILQEEFMFGTSDILGNNFSMTVSGINNSTSTSDYYEVYAFYNTGSGSNNYRATASQQMTYFTGYKIIT